MTEQFDTVIVGAGIGGLTGAARLAKAGQRVLVLDRNPHPGGTAYVYHRQGFSFPTGPLGFSNREIVQGILDDLGAGEYLTWKRVNYRLMAFNINILLSLPFPEMVTELKREFPGESNAVESFFEDIRGIISVIKRPGMAINSKTRSNLQVSSAEYLNANIHDWRLRRILGTIGTQESYTSLPFQAVMWDLMSNEGIWYPDGGFQSFCNRLVREITKDDGYNTLDEPHHKVTGTIRLKTEVKRIRVDKGRICGVTLADGTAIDAPVVISNADYKTTFLKLLELDPSDEMYAVVSRARQTGSILQVSAGLNKNVVDLSAFNGASRLIYRRYPGDSHPEENNAWNEEYLETEALANQELELSLWSNEDTRLSPDWGAVVVIRTEAPYSHFKRFRLGAGGRIPGYLEYKNRLGKTLIREAEKLLPGLESAIAAMDVATPLTFEDQGGRSEGAVAGWSWNYEDSHDYRSRELVLTPIKGLYMAGYQAFSSLFMGGVPTAMMSGYRAAKAVLRNDGPIDKLQI